MAASERIMTVVRALPLRPGLRVLEIGCGPGAAAREVVERVAPGGFVLAIDRSPRAVALARSLGEHQIASRHLDVRCASIEQFELGDEQPFDLAFAIRVGALDGRHPAAGELARRRIRDALTSDGVLVVDGGEPIPRDQL